ncbi:30S ribosomal protein S3 [Candidatus Wolfebacteria bacterium CG03_land_8_20_14_0_80_40_12]|uniref:Small ribosomal subunit protein uS3 n=1 Tax=Candidatus Wolfebacteria bacterium CG03_land_8_20_14_0_80_40_12 TaxID=1975069 RepID=A0A2M7B690_9BACT|nr:MAG: 30S ribosomal protein S3 [Candidatus Wolfebacteria bacterium CG03_land_8_20_14_0_80_40_12]
MGQKIKPNSLRIGITKGWLANWLPKKFNFKNLLEEDVLIRETIKEKIANAGIDRILIEKTGNNCRILIRAARPGLIIGRGGKGIEELTKLLDNRLRKLRKEKGISGAISLSLNIEEIKRSEVSANVVAQNIAWDLEKRLPFRRIIKRYLEQVLQNREVQGAKILVKGRLNGAEIARDEHLEKGKLPLQTLRANIDYGEATAFTTFGTVGVKTWIYKGEIFDTEQK